MLENHQKYALLIFAGVVGLIWLLDGKTEAVDDGAILFAFLIPIFAYRIIAFFSGFGFPEFFAKDFGSENNPGPYAFFFWVLYLIACLACIFDWQLY